MGKYTLNKDGVDKARSMIDADQYVLESDWSEAQPSSDEGNEALERREWDEYGQWFLAIDNEASEETKGHYNFPYGDFQRVHRSGLIAAKQRAAQNDYSDIEQAADDLLARLDEHSG